jgi:hypothetical protein
LNPLIIYYYCCVFSGIIPIFFYLKEGKSSYNRNNIERYLLFYSVSRLIIDIAIVILSNTIKNSFPAIHISIFVCFYFAINILNEIDQIKNIKFYLLGGSLLFILDLTFTSTIFKPCLLSSLTTFFIIIALSIKALQKFDISRENEKLIGYFLIFYLVAFAYYLYLELMSYSVTIMYWAFFLFTSINILFNFSISHILWLRRRI